MKKFERNFYTKPDELGYNKYINTLKLPLKLQKLLHYKRKLPAYISYIDIVEKEETISMISVKSSLGMGVKGIYKKPNQKTAFTFNKKGRSNARIRIWAGSKITDMRILMEELAKYLNINIEWLNKKDLGLSALVTNPMTKGMWSMILTEKIKSYDDLLAYWVKYSLRIKIDSQYLNEVRLLLSNYYDYNTRRILHTSINPNELLEGLTRIPSINLGHIQGMAQAFPNHFTKDPLFKCKNVEMLCENLQALDMKIDWLSTKEEFDDIEKKTINMIDKAVRLYEMWDKGQEVTDEALNDLPF